MGAAHKLKVAPEIQAIINECAVDSVNFLLKLPSRQLDRKVYCDVKKVAEAAGGKWSTPKQGFIFPCLPDLLTCRAAGHGEEIVRKKVVQQAFYTPSAVADALVAFAGVGQTKKKISILEPQCGQGALITAALKAAPNATIRAYDNDPDAHSYCLHTFMDTIKVGLQDFLTVTPPKKAYDFVLMNPPYQNGQAMAHFIHASKFIKKKGARLAAILPATFEVVNDWYDYYDIEVLPVPAGAFKESGTMIATKIVKLAHL